MAEDGSKLNDKERAVRDVLKKQLGERATVTEVKQQGDRIKIHVISPNNFDWTADDDLAMNFDVKIGVGH